MHATSQKSLSNLWRSRLSSTASVIVLVTALSLLALEVYDSIRDKQRAGEDAATEVFEHLQRQTFVYARMLSDNSQIRRGAHFNNTAMISKYIQSVQRQLKVDTITVHNDERIILAMAHDPTSFNISDSDNEDIQRSLEGLSHSNIDFTSQPVAIQTSVPVYHENDDSLIVGTVTVGYFINASFATDIRRISGLDVLFVLDNEVLTTSFSDFALEYSSPEHAQVEHANTTYDISPVAINNEAGRELALVVAINNFTSKVTLWLILLSIPLLIGLVVIGRRQAIEREKSRHQAIALETQREAAMRLQTEVDERKKAQGELEVALEVAQTANRLKDQFLANVSHELRTPLNSLMNVPRSLLSDYQLECLLYCASCNEHYRTDSEDATRQNAEPCPDCDTLLEVQERMMFNGDPATHHHYLAIADRNSVRLFHVVDSLLCSSEIDAGRLELEAHDAEIETIFSDIVRKYRAKANAKNIALGSNVAVIAHEVRLDTEKLVRVLDILVDNAIEFSDAGDSVHLSVKEASSGDDARPTFEFAVSDTGPGIALVDLPALFDKFRQIDGSHTRAHQGLGLGLTIAKGLVEIQGGTLEVTSECGKGSTFSFRVENSIAAPTQERRP